MMQQQLEQQREQMNQQLDLQRHHVENQLKVIEAHLVEAKSAFGPHLPRNQIEPIPGGDFTAPEKISAAPNQINPIPGREFTVPEKNSVPSNQQAPPVILDEEMIRRSKAKLEQWTKCSGLHTVNKWLENYRQHPAGWAALLMIHGVPEVTGRLRQKVQNYATFSALFLAGSIKATSGRLPVCNPDTEGTWECEILKRVYSYFFFLTIASHILCIFLAMSFHNALNEAARDSDVFRMFARGKGFKATMKCQWSFRVGAAACFVALTAVAVEQIGLEMLAWAMFLFGVALAIYRSTSDLLFSNASIVNYWRTELGGKPDPDDPYDLDVPLEYLRSRMAKDRQGWNANIDDAPPLPGQYPSSASVQPTREDSQSKYAAIAAVE
eukprot:gnl/MRDRNA2_/MRDRNA2_24166_c0_seq1.p1 gnl/MRDRNA2_/MRDRNA2_24166_c0~~gnl/MRDRNA2_/MRDRNA2_24166_c0_seq1.p1  ORF type:complete len:381 (+),score=66.15 gnl/MRDRNA2_/MRDRNA2_24166_c0_seq1:11-1153(+)